MEFTLNWMFVELGQVKRKMRKEHSIPEIRFKTGIILKQTYIDRHSIPVYVPND